MEIVWTQHAEERQQQWEQRLGITRQEVEAVVINPEQMIPDDEGILVAQSRRGNGLLRGPLCGNWLDKAHPHRLLDKSSKTLLAGITMRMQDSADADVLILILRETPPVNAISEPGGVIVSYDEAGEPVSIEFLNASKRQLIRPGETTLPIQM